MIPATFDADEFLILAGQVREDCMTWIEGMKTPGKPAGYFRFNAHSYHPWALYASICAFALLRTLGKADQLNEKERKQWARMYLDVFHKPSGRFLCPQLYGTSFRGDPSNLDDQTAADRAAPFKKIAADLFELGEEIPQTNTERPSGFKDIADIERFFDGEAQKREPYSYGSLLGGFAQERFFWLQSMNRNLEKDPWIEWYYEYVEKRRSPVTGLMTGASEDRMLQMDGLFKALYTMLKKQNRPMPHAQKVIDSVLDMQDPEKGFGEVCEDYNATKLLCSLCIQEQGYRYSEVLDAVTGIVLERLKKRRRKNGGFSMHTTHCLTHVNSIPISDSLAEGDLMGTGQQMDILREIESLILWNKQ